MAFVHIPKGDSLGRTRSEQEENIFKEWGTRSMSEEKLDKLKFLERKKRDGDGSRKNFIGGHEIDMVK